jgi:hypothetical protein
VNGADRVIRWSTALAAVLGVAGIAAVVSYEHASALVRAHGESGWTGRLIPLTVDGLIYASSMVMLDAARRGARVPALARWLLGLGIVATLAANIAHGLSQGVLGAVVGAWPAVALVGSYELLMVIIRGSQVPAVAAGGQGEPVVSDPLGDQAVLVFAADLAAERVPSIRAIRAQLHVGQLRAQRLRDFLAAGAVRRVETPAA